MVSGLSHGALQRVRHRPRATAIASVLLLCIGLALAASGVPDPGFNSTGLLSLKTADLESEATAALQQTDGKLVFAGWDRLNGSPDNDFIVMRVLPDGTRDSAFGTNGVASARITDRDDNAYAVIQQTDGKLVLAGRSGDFYSSDVALARFNSDGTLDATFGSGGTTLAHLGGVSYASALVQQPDGKLVVAGRGGGTSCGQGFMMFARFETDGSLDTTFGTGGMTLVYGFGAEDLAQQKDGKLVAVGVYYGAISSGGAIARVTANGALDPSFDGDGQAVMAGYAIAVAFQPDGKIVLADGGATVFRLNEDGTPDDTFKTTGVGLGYYSDALTSIVVQADGKVVAAGTRHRGRYDMFLVRFLADGRIDRSYGLHGIAMADFGTGNAAKESEGSALIQQADGKHVAVGSIKAVDPVYATEAFGAARFDDGAAFAGRFGLTRTDVLVRETTPTVTYTVRRTGGDTGAVSVDYATAGGTAQPGSDFQGASDTLTWSDGDASDRTITVNVVDDGLAEDIREPFTLTLSAPTGGAQLAATQGTTTIMDDDGSGELMLSDDVNWQGGSEGAGVLEVPVRRVNGSKGAISVGYEIPDRSSTTSASATPGEDYVAVSGTLNWKDGETYSKFIPVEYIVDGVREEPFEYFPIRLVDPNTGSTAPGPHSTETMYISDDDFTGGANCENGGELGLDRSTATIGEGAGSVTFTVLRGGPTATGIVSVNYTTSPGSATAESDFTSTSGTLTWPDGDTTGKTFTVNVASDAEDEPDETFVVDLTGPSAGALVVSPASATVTIIDDDAPVGGGSSSGGSSSDGNGGGGGATGVGLLELLALLSVFVIRKKRRATKQYAP